MVPAEENPVVGVRRAAARVLDHVVDFAPLGSDVAARDDAATVAKADGTPLVVAEHPFQRAELHDPACVVEHNPLHRSGARDMPGGSDYNVHRSGGPIALITNRCLFAFDRDRRRFTLRSVHPGHTLAEVIVNTGFEFDRPPEVPVTPVPSAETLRLMRQAVAPELAEVYPQFAARVFGAKIPSPSS